MQEVFKRLALVAASDTSVHLFGESGVGKELVARAIHRYSRRADGPFVAVNVASLSPTLAESELFGHVRGAFTGADQSRRGLLEQSHGGTIFFDEVADIPSTLQVKLLRVLERGEVWPVGAETPVRTDFRVLSATHRNLCDRVADGLFRHDLYFRLIAFEIAIPPLRERREDIAELADFFLNRIARQESCPKPVLSEAALERLRSAPWYGNVRELRNAVEHATILARGGQILPEHLPAPAPRSLIGSRTTEETMTSLVRQWTATQLEALPDDHSLYEHFMELVEPPLLSVVLEHAHDQYAVAARRLGLHRATLRKKLPRR